MAFKASRLPSRFPVGTKFVIEGRRGGEGQVQVYSRYLEFPDGTFLPLPTHPVRRKSGMSRRSGKSRLPRQIGATYLEGFFRVVGHWPRCRAVNRRRLQKKGGLGGPPGERSCHRYRGTDCATDLLRKTRSLPLATIKRGE